MTAATKTLRPLRDQVAIRLNKDTIESSSDLTIIHDRKPNSIRWREATVLAVGPKVHEVRVGDCVVLKAFIGQPAEHNGEPILLLPEDDLEAIKEH